MDDDYESLAVTFIRRTFKAALLDYGFGDPVWTPMSCLSAESADEVARADKGDLIEVEVAGWWARREDLVDGD